MVTDIFKKAVSLGFGAWFVTKENVEEVINEMVKKGEIKKEEATAQAKELFHKILSSRKDIESKFEEIMEKVLQKLDIPTRREFQQLQKKLDEVIKKLESQEEEDEGSSRKDAEYH